MTLGHDALRALPKAELHLHLEGAVSASTARALARKHGVVLGAGDPDALFRFDDLGSFLRMYGRICAAMRDADDFFLTTYEALQRVADAGGRYVELFFSPAAHDGIAYGTMLDGIGAAFAAAATDVGVDARLVPAHNRELGPECGEAFLDLVLADRRPFVIGIGLDYMENDPAAFARMFARARTAGLHRTAHAGEVGPAANVRDSLDALGCERIDHGYHVVDDAALVARCRTAGTFFTCCPTTTTYTTGWRDLDAPDHAVRRMMESGLAITINTDDPGLMRTTLVDEYRIVHERLGATESFLKDLCLNGLRASWLDPAEKARLIAAWSAEIDAILVGERAPAAG